MNDKKLGKAGKVKARLKAQAREVPNPAEEARRANAAAASYLEEKARKRMQSAARMAKLQE